MHDDIEDLLRRARPAGPPPELRGRLVTPWRKTRDWPWAVAAAALFATVVGVHAVTAFVTRSAVPTAESRTAASLAFLTDYLGGDDEAREIGSILLASEQMRAAGNAARVVNPMVGGPR